MIKTLFSRTKIKQQRSTAHWVIKQLNIKREVTLQNKALTAFVTEKIADMKGRDITTLDIADKSDFADYMIVASGNSSRHVKSIAQSLVTDCRAEGVEPLGIEGNDVGEWALVDLGDIVIHIMTDESRDKYQLEQLWE